jgi:phosphate uptake regulator
VAGIVVVSRDAMLVLERIADDASNIARVVLEPNKEPELKNHVRLRQMGDVASAMLQAALDASLGRDADAAREDQT